MAETVFIDCGEVDQAHAGTTGFGNGRRIRPHARLVLAIPDDEAPAIFAAFGEQHQAVTQ